MTDADRQALVARVKANESCRLRLYPDAAGLLTIGWGHCIEIRGISQAIADAINVEDVDLAEADAVQWLGPAYETLDGVRQQVVVELSFSLGLTKLKRFVGVRAALIARDYVTAAARLRSSKWCRDVKAHRCGMLSTMLETGVAQ